MISTLLMTYLLKNISNILLYYEDVKLTYYDPCEIELYTIDEFGRRPSNGSVGLLDTIGPPWLRPCPPGRNNRYSLEAAVLCYSSGLRPGSHRHSPDVGEPLKRKIPTFVPKATTRLPDSPGLGPMTFI